MSDSYKLWLDVKRVDDLDTSLDENFILCSGVLVADMREKAAEIAEIAQSVSGETSLHNPFLLQCVIETIPTEEEDEPQVIDFVWVATVANSTAAYSLAHMLLDMFSDYPEQKIEARAYIDQT